MTTTTVTANTDPNYIKLYTDVIFKAIAKRTDPGYIRKTVKKYHGQTGRIMNTGYSTKGGRRHVGVMFDDGVMLWADTTDLEQLNPAPAAIPTDGFEDDAQLTRVDTCKLCGFPIPSCELCAECAKDNDPFFTSKYTGDHVR
jgi:hypothetical protein